MQMLVGKQPSPVTLCLPAGDVASSPAWGCRVRYELWLHSARSSSSVLARVHSCRNLGRRTNKQQWCQPGLGWSPSPLLPAAALGSFSLGQGLTLCLCWCLKRENGVYSLHTSPRGR